MKIHTCTMFCECPTAQRLAGGTAAERAGTPRPAPGSPTSVREAVARAERDLATMVHVRDPR